MNLHEQLAFAIAEAQKALEAGELDKGREWREKAETLKAAIEELEKVKGLTLPQADPIRPPMPGKGDGETSPEPPAESHPAIKAFYIRRFGEQDAYVKSILTDLHGPSYEEKYWNHKALFWRYMRRGDETFSGDERKALRELIMTPPAVIAAVERGADVAMLKSTMVEASDTLGGYVVPVDFNARIIERLAGLTVVRPLATIESTSRDKFERPVSTGGGSQFPNAVTVTWVDETPTAGTAETNLTYGMESIPIHTVMAETPLSRNMLEDAAYNLEGHLTKSFAEALAIDEDNRFLTGDGNGRPQGILPSSANALSLSYGFNPTSTTAVEWDGLISTTFKGDAQYRQRAVWVGEKATYEDIALLKDGNGQYLWRDRFGNNAAGSPGQLCGYPWKEQEALPSVAADAFPLIFGDFSGYTIVDRVGMSVERYLDSQTARQNLVYFIMRRRLGGQVTESWRFVLYKVATS